VASSECLLISDTSRTLVDVHIQAPDTAILNSNARGNYAFMRDK